MYLTFDIAPKEVFWPCKTSKAGGPGDACEMRSDFAWKHCPESLHRSLCCVSSCFEHHLCMITANTKALVFEQAGFKISSTSSSLWSNLVHVAHPPTCCCSTRHFFWGYVKSKIYETWLVSVTDLKTVYSNCNVGILEEMLQCVTTTFFHDCWSVLNDMVATYKMSCSDNNN